MIMDSDYTKSSKIDHEQTIFPNSDEHPNFENGFKFDVPSPDLNLVNVPFDPPDSETDNFRLSFNLSPVGDSFVPSVSLSPDGGPFDPLLGRNVQVRASYPSEDSHSSDPVLKYISQILMEENTEDKPHTFHDHFALKATEKSLYDVLGQQYPPSLNSSWPYNNHESLSSIFLGSGSDYGGNTSTITATGASGFVDIQWVHDVGELNPSLLQTSLPVESHFLSDLRPSLQFSVNASNGLHDTSAGFIGSSVSKIVQNMLRDRESVLQFPRGLEENSKFLPSASQLVIDLESNTFSSGEKEKTPVVVVEEEKIDRESSTNGSRGWKNHEQEDSEKGRNNKQSAVYAEESELSDLFDKVLLWTEGKEKSLCFDNEAEQGVERKTTQTDEQSNGSNGRKNRARKQCREEEIVDLSTLLILCAQAVSASDFRAANELLKQIRQHSSPFGDGSQRVAHYFAKALEARMAGRGTGTQNFFTSFTSRGVIAADILTAYQTQHQAAPFKRLSIAFTSKMISHAAEKATTLHIVDFGILCGFQWPILIQHLSTRTNGPPKLRITGIELPQHGFQPAERIDETGRRLAKYCERFNVPFEYNLIPAQNWERIPIEDLKINSNEVLAVNCLSRFKNLLDEALEVNCPRDAVLKLIRKMNPDIFVHTIINGSYNTPFFVTRFREALFHFSSLFDMYDSTLPREDQARLMIERDFYGQEVMNAIACEGPERVERPETYRQWQVRNKRAGFKQLPLDQELMQKLRDKWKTRYHEDFLFDEDCHWMLQGWKGRIIYASSRWVPA